MHGPKKLNSHVISLQMIEDAFNLPMNTVKVGIMDEEEELLSI